MKNLCFVVAVLLLLHVFPAHSQSAAKDVVRLQYAPDKQNIINLYLPKAYTEATPVVILLHGGGWVHGSLEDLTKTARDLSSRGFIVANTDYRYVNDSVHCREVLADIDKAITFVQKSSKQYHFKSDGYHLAGISAGAHLALLYGYTSLKGIKSITALCPVTQLDDADLLAGAKKMNLIKNVELLANATYAEGKIPSPKFTTVSPYAHVKNVPTLLFHGDNDNYVPYTQSAFLYEVLKQKKVPSKFVTLQGQGHSCGMDEPDKEKQILDEIVRWVEMYN